ncbi:glycosyl transferase [Blastocladiella britannica]|nr:glycosyl transferase [Blastocladiella britannica]
MVETRASWSLLAVFGAAFAAKLLLIPGYHSTDFEVHRNWLAITHSLPVRDWYYETTSEWTLDYPPFFAWFEWALSHAAQLADPAMLVVGNLDHASFATVAFQRISVSLTDAIIPLGLLVYFSVDPLAHMAGPLAVLNAGLWIVDHIHFQYNGFMFGLLIASIGCFRQGWTYTGAALFAALLNFKHIYLYIAPAIFVYLLSSFCFEGGRFRFGRFAGLGATVATVFALSIGPFAAHGPQLLSRLFPFKRGLFHAYWAPNAWALYAFADRALIKVLPRLGVHVMPIASSTRGLVGDVEFAVLPPVLPIHTLILTVLGMLPFLWRLWRNPTSSGLVRGIVHCAFASFIFGWHVHEKAVLNMIIPLSLIALESYELGQIYFVLTTLGTYALFPMLIDPADTMLRWSILVAGSGLAWCLLDVHHRRVSGRPFALPSVAAYYLLGLLPLEWFVTIGHPILFGATRLPFLPLMMVSVYGAIGMVGCWVWFACLESDPASALVRGRISK